MKESVSIRPLVLIFILLVAGIAATGQYSYNIFEEYYRDQAEKEVKSISDMKMKELIRWQEERIADANSLQHDPAFAALVHSFFKNPQDTAVQTQIKTILTNYRKYADYEDISLIDLKGQTRLINSDELRPVSSAIARQIPEVVQSKQVGFVDFYHCDVDQDIDLTLLVPIIEPQKGDQVIGIVALSVFSNSSHYPFVLDWPVPSRTAEVFLVRREENSIVFLTEARFQKNAPLNLRIPLDKKVITALEESLGQEDIIEGLDYRGKKILGNLRKVPNTPWFMVVKIDSDEVYAPLRTRWWETFGFVVMGILIAGAGLLAFWRRHRLIFYREQAEASKELTRLSQRNELILSSAAEGILGLDLQGNHTFVNPSAAKMLGYQPEEMVGRHSHSLWHHTRPDGTPYPNEECPIYTAYRDGRVHRLSTDLFWRKDGSSFPVEYASTPIYEHGGLTGAVVTFIDITERRRTEEALRRNLDLAARSHRAMLSALEDEKRTREELKNSERQLQASQKMEAIGRLSGGVAHDFNNLLGIINGYSELSLSGLKDSDPLRENLKEIHEAGERAAALTRQLLAFSRRQVFQSKVFNLNDIIVRTERMLQRLIGEDINLATFSEPGLGLIKADPSQMEQVIMNLAVNARDAMPKGGKLTIETKNVVLDRTGSDWAPDVREGRYVVMSVTDTGIGMDPKMMEHIFEPFFTTKEKGKGTGLGLSTVYGIVKQSGGHVTVYSEPGHGTSVKVYLPRVNDDAEISLSPHTPATSLEGSETILVVEDEERLRKLVCRVLREKGYTVLHAPSGREALKISKLHKKKIDLLLTDVIMPGMTGRETAEQLKSLRPGIKVVYMSGYTDDAIVRHGILEEGVHFLPKPFTSEGLVRKLREIFETKA